MSEYISAKDQAVAIRRQLAGSFPGIKFSVRKEAGGGSIRVAYVDGPTEREVQSVLAGYEGGGFDGMTDCAYGKASWFCEDHGAKLAEVYGSDNGLNGPVNAPCCERSRIVHFIADFVFVNRALSPAAQALFEDWVAARYGAPYEQYRMLDHRLDMGQEARRRSHQVSLPAPGEAKAARAQLEGAPLPAGARGDLLAASAAARVVVVVND